LLFVLLLARPRHATYQTGPREILEIATPVERMGA